MKLKHALIPYALIIVIVPGILSHLGAFFGIPMNTWQWIMDGIMAATALIGLIAVLIQRKKEFRGWIPMLVLLVFFLLPQLYLWKSQNKSFYYLRLIYRFALLYLTLFVIPLEIHLTHKDLLILIGCFVVYGLICCGYELWQHPRPWETMNFFNGKGQVMSFFEQKNRFAAYLALWIILCAFAVYLSRSKLWIIPAVIFMAFLIMTESRGGLLLTGLFLLMMIISFRRRLGMSNMIMILLDIAIVLGLLFLIPSTRDFLDSLIDADRGVTGRDKIWEVSWNYYLESNPFLGHGIGVQIEKIMIERLSLTYNAHNVYLYILNSGGICLLLFYLGSLAIILTHPCYRHHYLIPLVIAVLGYGCFELSCAAFDYWHLSNMFTVCLFFIPAASGLRGHHSPEEHHHHHHHHHHHGQPVRVEYRDGIPIYSPDNNGEAESSFISAS